MNVIAREFVKYIWMLVLLELDVTKIPYFLYFSKVSKLLYIYITLL